MWPYPKVIAHRGGGTLAPENTIAAMQCGLDFGYRAVEFDVMLSMDGVPVLMHDPLFGRTVRGEGGVASTSAPRLLEMDAGSWYSESFIGEKVPSYEQVVRFCQQHDIWMNVEIKPVPGFEQETGRVVAQLTQALHVTGARAPLFSSFSFEALASAQKQAPEIARGLLFDEIPADWLSRLQQLAAVALHCNHKHLSPALAQQIKQAGYGLLCYTVNTPERALEIRSWGVDAFCTDKINLIPADF
ncbi:MAG: glycerophosphodiester phosphodiesterase [Burkholderiales bacterium]|nr:glycerophosphodiester phosphodiesterase [Burkholderiales bacterium]